MTRHSEKFLQRSINWLCAIVFAVFTLTFIAVYQAPLLEAYYDKVANGKLMYNEYVVAAIATTLLVLLALWLNRITKFQREWTAMAYFPSCLLLAFITDIDASIYTGGKPQYNWLIIMSIGLFVYVFSAFLLRHVLFAQIKNLQMEGNRIVWRNLLLFTIFFCLVGSLSNGNENLRNEAAAYRHYKRGDLDAALGVAKKSIIASQELTSARAFYLAKKNMLGDKLFHYPQYYGVDGLLPHLNQTSPLSPDTVYAALGVKRNENESALEYLRRAVQADSLHSPMLADYYLCALLLDKRVDEFILELPKFYELNNNNDIPHHYKEAMIYYAVTSGNCELPFNSDTLRAQLLALGLLNLENTERLPKHYIQSFIDYVLPPDGVGKLINMDSLHTEYNNMMKLEAEHPELHVRSNYIRRYYGKTYWWYISYDE